MELCILLGCDYLEPVKGIGPKTALKLIKEHGSLASIEQFVRGKMAEKKAEAEVIKAEMKAEAAKEEAEEEESEEEEEAPTSPGIDIDLESEDGYDTKATTSSTAQVDQPEDSPVKIKRASAGKKKVAVDSDDESDADDKPATKPKNENAGWESSPEPESAATSKQPTGSDAKKPSTPAKKKAPTKKAASKVTDASPSKPKKVPTGKGGMQLPDFWPWEEAKKIFLQPDVQKGDDIEVSLPLIFV